VLVITQAGMSSEQEWTALIVFVLLASLTVALPVLYYLIGGEKSKAKLDEAKVWLVANNAAVMAVLLLVFGLKLLSAGAQGLIAG
jgi:low temperature requirement protein LtrA